MHTIYLLLLGICAMFAAIYAAALALRKKR